MLKRLHRPPPKNATERRTRAARWLHGIVLGLAVLSLQSLAGCAAEPVAPAATAQVSSPQLSRPRPPAPAATPAPATSAATRPARQFPKTAPRTAGISAPVSVLKPPGLSNAPVAGTTLRFENADIYEVIQVVLGDILHLNYLVDPAVQGRITLNTQQPVSTADVFGILESVLRLHNISIVREGPLYKVLRDASATRDAIGFVAAGENSPLIRVVPLKFVQASALVNVLRNFVGPQGAITNDATNRYLILADRASNVTKLLGMIASLDVDYLQHIRIRIVQIEKGDATELAREMDQLFRSSGLFNWPGTDGTKVYFMPVVRMNAVLVAAANDALLAAAEKWIKRLDDEPADGVGSSIHVYSIENSNALHIADILRQIYGGAPIASSTSTQPSRVVVRGNVPAATAAAGTGLAGSVQIIPDEATNSLVIKASPQDFLQIKKVIRRIDTTSRQVMIQVMVAEVTLTDSLQYGVEWWLKNRTAPLGLDTGLVASPNNPVISVPANAASGGLNLLLLNSAGDITGLFNLLASNTDVNILSAPHVLASDGKVAKIEVGSEEPVVTQTVSTPTTTLGGTGALSTSNSVQYRPTGILLEVKPSINASGRVTLAVTQEVSARGSNVEVGGSVYPSFTKRRVSTEVTLEEGRTLMIAGLIQDNGNDSSQGLPSLKDIPVLGLLFGSTKRERDKTELMMTITPYIVRDRDEGERLTRSFQDSVAKLKGLMQKNPVPALAEPNVAR
ncbi:MAG: type II secretion system protein GspD [Betaproteobacteria bacterium RIFCSPLOWO2_12_FULL_63_13]|nr:MAG: type II secretion system protein GspD [Betaproteobacteria bacterium RIFCSPLOWO2_12_FULL_63_13]